MLRFIKIYLIKVDEIEKEITPLTKLYKYTCTLIQKLRHGAVKAVADYSERRMLYSKIPLR